MASVIPNSLMLTTRTLSNFQRNRYRLESISTDSIGPNRRINVSLKGGACVGQNPMQVVCY